MISNESLKIIRISDDESVGLSTFCIRAQKSAVATRLSILFQIFIVVSTPRLFLWDDVEVDRLEITNNTQ